MADKSRLEELISLYALDALEGDELKEVEEYIKNGSPEALELLKENKRIASLMSYSAKSVSPHPRLKKRLFEEISPSKELTEDSGQIPFWSRFQPLWLGLGGAVAAALVIILFISNQSLRGTLDKQRTQVSELNEMIEIQKESIKSIENRIVKKELEISELEDKLASQTEITSFLEDPNVVIINLVNLKPDLKAVGRVIWNTKDNEALFYCLNLPQLAAGKTYQWWVIADGTPKSAGIFNVNDKGTSVIKLESLSEFGKIQKFAVTLEPADGVPKPTGPMYLIGDT